ncbi:cytochrome P450 86B1-like [Nymphaea colorata]|uniref:cytochrome P450 86B1-like n=1 Tax=Nymphaea colorata TaxID=210225 RepID=UPI00129ED484|nr:cytochrome P450 86B1-like [Nymphaea colorata]
MESIMFPSSWCFGGIIGSLRWPELCLSLLTFYLIHHFVTHRNQPLRSWPLLGELPSALANIHRLFDWGIELFSKHGGTIEFHGPILSNMHVVATCDPRNIEHMLKSSFHNFPKGDEFRDIFFDLMGDGILNADLEPWKQQRKMANSLVHSKAFRGFVASNTQHMVRHKLLPVLHRLTRAGSAFDIQDVLLRYTFDNTCTAIFGECMNALSIELDSVPFTKAMDDIMEAIAYRYVLPRRWWKVLRLLKLGKERQMAEGLTAVNDFVARQLEKRKKAKGSSAGVDLLSTYASVSSDEVFLRDAAINFLVAGRDASAATLVWFFWLLSKNPYVKKKILEEQRMILAETQRDCFEIEDLSKMVYLHASICETLRLYPTVPIGQKGVVKEDVLPSGTVVKPGTVILYAIFAVGMMDWVWGKDCLEFKPERWLDDQAGLRHETNGWRFLAFNGGPRTCLGKDMAFVQMKYAAAEIMLNFEIDVVEGHQVSPKPSVIMTMKNGLMVKAKAKPNRCLV